MTNDLSVSRIDERLFRLNFQVNFAQSHLVQWSMQVAEQLDSGTIERLRKQDEFLRRIYRAEFARNPTSLATESSRSNVIAVRHTVRQMYGEVVAPDRVNFVATSQNR